MLRKIARWELVGWNFIFVGDPRGQFLPIFDRWGEVDLTSLERSSLLHNLCNGLKIELEVYRRGVDQSLFDYYFSLYQKDMTDPRVCRDCVEEACTRYPYNDEAIDHALFLSDRKRRYWNARKNLEDVDGREYVVCVECEKDDDDLRTFKGARNNRRTCIYIPDRSL